MLYAKVIHQPLFINQSKEALLLLSLKKDISLKITIYPLNMHFETSSDSEVVYRCCDQDPNIGSSDPTEIQT